MRAVIQTSTETTGTTTQSGTAAATGKAAATGTRATGTPSTRERLLEAATELFYAEGTVAVGVDRVCQQAKVSKRSMYQLFATKDDLVAASLQRFGERLQAGYLPGADDIGSARERILDVFAWQERSAATPEYLGCPFVNAATELKDVEHPGFVVAQGFKQQLTDFFEHEAEAAGVADPKLLAQQLTVIFDGCAARVAVTRRPLNGLAVTTATTLLDSALTGS